MNESHLAFVRDYFRMEVYVVTEYRDGAVYRTKKVGEVACQRSASCVRRPGMLVAKSW